jgi:hypothetical protein
MKKLITILILSVCFFVPFPMVSAITNSQNSAQMEMTTTNTFRQIHKPNWIERMSQKLLVKKMKKSGSGKFALGFILLTIGLILLVAGGVIWITDATTEATEPKTGGGETMALLGLALSLLGLVLGGRGTQQLQAMDKQNQDKHEQLMNTLINKEKADIISLYGSFFTSISDGKGGEILRFDNRVKKDGESVYINGRITTKAPSVTNYYTEFYINKNGIVYKWNEGKREE